MPKKLPPRDDRSLANAVLDLPEASVLDVLDHVLTKGVMATGDVTLGVAGVDLIYLRLSALLCATDRVMPAAQAKQARRRGARRRARSNR
jgi:gas vesicle structural protein